MCSIQKAIDQTRARIAENDERLKQSAILIALYKYNTDKQVEAINRSIDGNLDRWANNPDKDYHYAPVHDELLAMRGDLIAKKYPELTEHFKTIRDEHK